MNWGGAYTHSTYNSSKKCLIFTTLIFIELATMIEHCGGDCEKIGKPKRPELSDFLVTSTHNWQSDGECCISQAYDMVAVL